MALNNCTPLLVADPHSFSNPSEISVHHMNLRLHVDFVTKTISGVNTLEIKNLTGGSELRLDTHQLKIESVFLDEEKTPALFQLGKDDPLLGAALIIKVKPTTKRVHVFYSTKADAQALQWLEPQQTAGKHAPFLLTQSEAIHARSWIPCQDSPKVRVTYNAEVKVPIGLMALMSAENPKEKTATGIYKFQMSLKIPSYLISLAVGDLEFRSLGHRTGVYAEPKTVDSAAWEFEETEKALNAGEKLFGRYRWGRFDLLVLPPSFPYGGMENPRLVFLTPTLLAGDRSQVNVVDHELGHFWSGNLVTNKDWNHFWINEGFTVYIERRLLEALNGREFSEMAAVNALSELEELIQDMTAKGESKDTHLVLNLNGRDPDDGVNLIPYEKGYLFLRLIEETVGRPIFDAFLNEYFNKFEFESVGTEDFTQFLHKRLIQGNKALEEKLMISDWLYGPGLPTNAPTIHSARLEHAKTQALMFSSNEKTARELEVKDWSTLEWVYFIRSLPKVLPVEKLRELDEVFGFSQRKNSEVLVVWLTKVIASEYEAAYSAVEQFLLSMGRGKYVKPLFTEMMKTAAGKKRAEDIFAKARPTYHSIVVKAVEKIIQEAK